jgi:2'-5' RNA ligase superfamily
MPLYVVLLVLPDSIEIKLDELRHGYAQKMNYIKIPHISLFPFSAEADIKKTVESKLFKIAESTGPITVKLREVGFFEAPWNVAYVSVNKNPEFIKLHGVVFDAIRSCTEKLDWAIIYEPDSIIPHVTIGEAIPPDILKVMKKELSGRALNVDVKITSFAILGQDENRQWKIIKTFQFNKSKNPS